jgi:hypothetical protein
MTINNFDENIDDSLATLDNIVIMTTNNVNGSLTAFGATTTTIVLLYHIMIIQPRQSLDNITTLSFRPKLLMSNYTTSGGSSHEIPAVVTTTPPLVVL